MNLDKIKELYIENNLVSLVIVVLVIIFISIQVNIWTGDYSFLGLQDLKKELNEKRQIALELEEKNLNLKQQKNFLKSERTAIEGLARSELGLIKPGEKFYRFEDVENKHIEIDLIKKEINE
tara:strand:+ start:4486 stop:4851 length:366 start_codon:yes stop_codon:yes gene_type:complete